MLAFTPHNYLEFVTRWKASNLLPKPADYVDFEAHVRRLSGLDDEFIDVVEAADPDLVLRALSAPGTVVEEVLGEELAAAALLEVLVIAETDVTGDVFLVMRFSGRLNTRKLPRDVVADLAAILLPNAEFSDLDWAPARVPAELAAKPGDTAIRWRR